MAARNSSNNESLAERDRRQSDVRLAVMQNDIAYMKKQLDHIDAQVTTNYVTREEFEPIKRIVYGVVGLVGIAVIGALLALVLKK